MRIAVPTEIYPGEQRVALSPTSATQLQKLGYDVSVQSGAGAAASFTDAAYRDAGVKVVKEAKALFDGADIVLKVRAPEDSEIKLIKPGTALASFIWPAQNPKLIEKLAKRGINAIAMDSVPRISRAQKMDALSSMANIAGYRAVVEASQHFGRFFTGQITAAGKTAPAKVMVIGAGVAGLAAIGAARSMGAIVRAFDTRPEVKQQVESMGAEFLELEFEEDGSGEGGYAKTMSKEFIDAEMALFLEQAREVDIIITTALIPGKPAPKLITTEMVKAMAEGSVVVDLAAEQGGNCELTKPGEAVVKHGVTVIGYTDLPSRMANQSSELYASNLRHLLTDMTPEKDGDLAFDMGDDVVRMATVTKDKDLLWPPEPIKAPPPNPGAGQNAAAAPDPEELARQEAASKRRAGFMQIGVLALVAAVLFLAGAYAPKDFLAHMTVFVLACFVGFQVIWSVSPALHTPLMSVTNAISGIIIIGALLQIGTGGALVTILAAIAAFVAMINIAGGFLVTQRMLAMFQKS